MDTVAPDYALHHRVEILAILDQLQAARVPTTVEFGDGHAIVSSVLEVRRDDHAIVFDIARALDLNRVLFAASSLSFVTELDGVQITFETRAPTLVALADGPAALVSLPSAIVRLQRREWFRAALPVQPPVRCTVLGPQGDTWSATATDLSCGGIGIVLDDAGPDVAASGGGLALVVSLPDIGPVALDATLLSVRPDETANGPTGAKTGPMIRMGFRFDHVPAQTANQIQRFVQRIEVEQLRVLRLRRGTSTVD